MLALNDLADEGVEESADGEETSGRPAKEIKHSSPGSTLESSFEALNVKKFDLTFAMDPLFRRTSAQFDEGGARGVHVFKLPETLDGSSQACQTQNPFKDLSTLSAHAGLLLNNLSVIRGLELMFDSYDILDRSCEDTTALTPGCRVRHFLQRSES